MAKALRELLVELEQLDIEIERTRPREVKARARGSRRQRATSLQSTSAWSARVPARTRRRVQHALEELPGPGGHDAPGYRTRTFAAICKVADAWDGKCLSTRYEGHKIPLKFECAKGHHFSMLIHMLRHGSWCQTCAYERATKYSLDEAVKLANARGGQCLSTHYGNSRKKLRWRCATGHEWLASLEGVVRGDWCQTCHFERIKPRQEDIERAAIERGGRCLSAYVDKETPLQWQCAEGHRWFAPWFRVSKGQWCHLCAVKARTRTIEQMQELAQSRGGRCLSTVYPGAHGKIEWQCEKGHVWHASVNSVWRGSWCPECAWASRRMARRRKQGKNLVPIMV